MVIYTSDQLNNAAPYFAALVDIAPQFIGHAWLWNAVVDPSVDIQSPIRKVFSDTSHGGLTDLIRAIESHNRIVHQYSIEK